MKRTWRIGLVLPALWLAATAVLAASVQVDGGLVSGEVTDEGMHVFLGVPYAAPPTGGLRWKPPQPVVPWQGVRESNAYCDSCTQVSPPPPPGTPKIFGSSHAPGRSEDCLYLNLWTSTLDPEAKLPVMFWIHGGGNNSGSSASSMFDGTALARQGVVVVTINYRLNLFGFFAHPSLSAESEHSVSGNYGLLDQIAALGWVQRNIARFGGDPGNVTIFGESAGGTDVVCLLVSPLADGLFHRAIAQSPWDTSLTRRLEKSWYGYPAGEHAADGWVQQLGCDAADDPVACLRAMPAVELLAAWGPVRQQVRFGHLADGRVIPDDIGAIFEAGAQHRVPLMAGITANEGTIFARGGSPKTVAELRAAIESDYGGYTDELLAVQGVSNDDDVPAAAVQGISDTWFGAACRFMCRRMEEVGQRAFLYRFSRIRPDPFCQKQILAFHGSELPYIFQTLDGVEELRYDERDVALSKIVSAYWVRFAKTGNPNGPGLPVWPAYSAASDRFMDLGDPVTSRSGMRTEAFDLLDRIYAERRAKRGQ
jgi:para-nitrobenzyl esterase